MSTSGTQRGADDPSAGRRSQGPVADLPQLQAYRDADARLTAPGAPFELVADEVLGQTVQVYANRPRSLREVLLGGTRHGDRDAYVFDDGRRTTFTELAGRVAAVARWLDEAHGIGPGDRVAIGAANCPEWILAFWAVTATGGCVVAMNGWWTATEMRRGLDLTRPSLVLLDERRRERLGDDAGRYPVAPLEDVGFPEPAGELPGIEPHEDDTALLLFTSGTTGRPKAAVLTHRYVVGYLLQQAYIGAREAMVAPAGASRPAIGAQGRPTPRLALFPLFHVSGLSFMCSTVLFGSPTVWPLGRFDAGKVIALTTEHGISAWNGAVTHVHRLLDHPAIEALEPTTITSVGVGGSASPPDLIRKTEARFPHLENTFASGYGATETALISYAANWMLTAAPNCVGPPLPGVEVEVRDDDGRPVPDGVPGHICVRSQATMVGYWEDDEADAETVLPGRWIELGDVGYLDRGVLHLDARARDLILRGGENVYPSEIENRLLEHPDVDEVAVVGRDHPELGQEVRAIVVPRPGAELHTDELRAFCAEELAPYKVPSVVDVRDEPLPRNASGKVVKHVLTGEGDSAFVEE